MLEGEASQKLTALSNPKAQGLFLDTVPEDLKSVPRVYVTTPERQGLAMGSLRLAVKPLEDGDIPAFKALFRLALWTGHLDLSSIDTHYQDAYTTLSGQRPDALTLKAILEGTASKETDRKS